MSEINREQMVRETTNKPRKKKKRKKKRYLLKFTLLVVVAVAVYLFLTSGFFSIDKVTVLSNSHYTKEQIVKISGVKLGDNLFETSSSDVKERLLKDPYIRECNTRKDPMHEYVIWVQERVDKVAIPYRGKYLILDEEGVILRETREEPTITVINGLKVTSAKIGDPVEIEENAEFVDTLKLVNEVDANDLYFKRIDVSTVKIRAYIYDSLICEGTPENIRANIKNINLLIQNLYSEGIERGLIKVSNNGSLAHSPEIE